MLFMFCFILLLLFGHGEISVEVVKVGQNVTLTCRRSSSSQWQGNVYWSRHSPNGVPEVLANLPFHGSPSTKIPHITATQLNYKEFHLHVGGVHLNDTGFYFCSETHYSDVSYSTAIFLLVKEQDLLTTAVLLDSSLHLDHSMNLHCSVLSGIYNKTCSEEKRLFWLKSGTNESVPNVLIAQETSECEQKSTNSCVFNLPITSSDTETFYCAVVSCGNILFSNGIKLNGSSFPWTIVLCLPLVTFLVVTLLLQVIWKQTSTDTDASTEDQQVWKDTKDSSFYTLVCYSQSEAGGTEHQMDVRRRQL